MRMDISSVRTRVLGIRTLGQMHIYGHRADRRNARTGCEEMMAAYWQRILRCQSDAASVKVAGGVQRVAVAEAIVHLHLRYSTY